MGTRKTNKKPGAATYAVIDERLQRCAKLTTDASYGKCARRMTHDDESLRPQEQSIATGGRYVGKGAPLIVEDIDGGIIEGNGLREGRRLCLPSEPKNPLPACRVELDFPTPSDMSAKDLPPGTVAVIRKCHTKGQDGELVPVATLDEALAASREFCDCTGTKADQAKRRKCARHGRAA